MQRPRSTEVCHPLWTNAADVHIHPGRWNNEAPLRMHCLAHPVQRSGHFDLQKVELCALMDDESRGTPFWTLKRRMFPFMSPAQTPLCLICHDTSSMTISNTVDNSECTTGLCVQREREREPLPTLSLCLPIPYPAGVLSRCLYALCNVSSLNDCTQIQNMFRCPFSELVRANIHRSVTKTLVELIWYCRLNVLIWKLNCLT